MCEFRKRPEKSDAKVRNYTACAGNLRQSVLLECGVQLVVKGMKLEADGSQKWGSMGRANDMDFILSAGNS